MSRLILSLLWIFTFSLQAEVHVVDATGTVVSLAKPAQRIVSLAPHLTEQAYSAGAGHRLVGVVNYSDYPAEAQSLPVIGSFEKISYEALIGLNPDLVLAWQSNGGEQILNRLKSLGFTVYVSESQRIHHIAKSIRDIGILAGNQQQSEQVADDFMTQYQQLVTANKHKPAIDVFYQLWHQPIMTTNNEHTISNALEVCGGVNVFGDALPVIPHVGVEAVVRSNPQVIVASGMDAERPEWLDHWKKWPQVRAVKVGALYSVPPDLLHRHTVRLLQGVALLCNHFDDARQRLGLDTEQGVNVGTDIGVGADVGIALTASPVEQAP